MIDRRYAASLAFFFAASLFAQDKVTIEGVLLDASTKQPISGATVAICYAVSFIPVDSVTTDASGGFRLPVRDAGTYAVEASAAGFLMARSDRAGIAVDEAALDDGATPTVHKLTLPLTRSAAMEGRVRDGDSEKPMAGLTVRALRSFWLRGERQLAAEAIAFTDSEGEFRLDPLPSGEYLVEISKRTAESVKQNSSKRYPILLWPPNDPDVFQPIELAGGTKFSTGVIDYSRVSLPKLRLAMAPAACPSRYPYSVALEESIGGAQIERQAIDLNCSAPVAIEAPAPGRYRLENKPGPLAIEPAEITLKETAEMDIELKAREAVRISGKISCDCEGPWMDDGRRVQVDFFSGKTGAVADVPKDGAFAIILRNAGMTWIDVKPLPAGMYVKQTLYHGAVYRRAIPLSPGASWIEVTLSDRPSGLTGMVVKEGQPVTGRTVILADWPLAPEAKYREFQRSGTDTNGRFTFSNLAPGTYRAAAVAADEWARRDEPGRVAGWLASAADIVLSEQSTAITLEARLP